MLTTFNVHTLHCHVMVTEAEMAYQDCYSYEVELNETFNRFASNFCLAYQGPNTASAQIKAKVDPKLSKSSKCYSIFVVSNNNIFSFLFLLQSTVTWMMSSRNEEMNISLWDPASRTMLNVLSSKCSYLHYCCTKATPMYVCQS